jgi:hypothetical protein
MYHDGKSKKPKSYILQNKVNTSNPSHVHGFIAIINNGKKCVEVFG